MGLSFRALDKDDDTIDFYLSSTRNAKAAKRFLGKTLAQRGDRILKLIRFC